MDLDEHHTEIGMDWTESIICLSYREIVAPFSEWVCFDYFTYTMLGYSMLSTATLVEEVCMDSAVGSHSDPGDMVS